MEKNLTNSDIPLGLGMALAQNTEALKAFGALTVPQQQDFIENAHTIQYRIPFQLDMQTNSIF